MFVAGINRTQMRTEISPLQVTDRHRDSGSNGASWGWGWGGGRAWPLEDCLKPRATVGGSRGRKGGWNPDATTEAVRTL